MWASLWLSGKEFACQWRRCRRLGFSLWVRKTFWWREWLPTPVFFPGEFHGQEDPGGLQSIGSQKSWIWLSWTWLSWICCCLDLTTKQLSLYTEQDVQHYLWSLWINVFTICGDWFLNWSSFHQLGGARKKRWSRQTLGKICSSPSVSLKCFHQSPYKWDLTTHISCPVPLINGKIILCKQLEGNKMLKTIPNCSHTSSFPSSKSMRTNFLLSMYFKIFPSCVIFPQEPAVDAMGVPTHIHLLVQLACLPPGLPTPCTWFSSPVGILCPPHSRLGMHSPSQKSSMSFWWELMYRYPNTASSGGMTLRHRVYTDPQSFPRGLASLPQADNSVTTYPLLPSVPSLSHFHLF